MIILDNVLTSISIYFGHDQKFEMFFAKIINNELHHMTIINSIRNNLQPVSISFNESGCRLYLIFLN